MITEQQRQERRLGIGGSDMPIILGLSNYKTPYQLYLEKKGLLESADEETPFQYWGNKLEPLIREEFSKRHSVSIEEPNTIIHPFYDFLRANVDGYIRDYNAVLEIKSSSQFMSQEWGEDGSDVIPMAYLVQVAHYCSCLNAEGAYIAVLIGGNDYREFYYKRDLELESTIISVASEFWGAVQAGKEPRAINSADLKIKFPSHINEKSICITRDISKDMQSLADVKLKIKQLEEIENKAKINIMNYMQDAECLIDESGKRLATWKSNKKGSRTFLLKGI